MSLPIAPPYKQILVRRPRNAIEVKMEGKLGRRGDGRLVSLSSEMAVFGAIVREEPPA
jgi:hypothetical protein